MIEVLKQALDALETELFIDWTNNDEFNASAEKMHDAITSLQQAIKELESQEPVAWKHDCAALLQNNVELWVDGCPHCGKPRTVHPPQRTEQNFCQRCGKRTNDIHTCTPPRNIEQEGKQMIDWYSVEGETRSYGVGMVACVYAIGRDEVVHVVTHESVKDIAMQHLPIQRTWVGLTDEDKHYLNEVLNLQGRFPIIEAIEAKLKEKNNA